MLSLLSRSTARVLGRLTDLKVRSRLLCNKVGICMLTEDRGLRSTPRAFCGCCTDCNEYIVTHAMACMSGNLWCYAPCRALLLLPRDIPHCRSSPKAHLKVCTFCSWLTLESFALKAGEHCSCQEGTPHPGTCYFQQLLLPCFAGSGSRCFAAQGWAVPKPQHPDLTFPLLNWQNNQVGDIVLPGSIFNVPIRKDILHRVVTWQLAKRRQVSLLAQSYCCIIHTNSTRISC